MRGWPTQFSYPTGTVTVTFDEYESRMCPGCGGPKSYMSGRCWKCAGSSQPKPVDKQHQIETRVLHVLIRNHPYYKAGSWKFDEREERDRLLAWAATLSDKELARMRNLGKTAIAWIRAQSVKGDVDVPRHPIVGRSVALRTALAFGEWPA